jgi:D-arabinose 1-dehydrogenase-like Zn-dependent alcohol dehydrogenase
MRSFKITAFGEALEDTQSETPMPTGTQVLLKIAACGACHSDVHIRDGFFDLGSEGRMDLSRGVPLPMTPGHEIAGEVVALGDAAAEMLSVGDARVVYPWIGCGTCETCASGDEQLCCKPRNLGVNVDGGYSDHVMVPHPRYLVPFDPMPIAEACTYACSGLTAFGALKKLGTLGAGEPLVIIGAGGVGLAAVRLAESVTGVAGIAADISSDSREAAMMAGARDVLDPGAPDAVRTFVKGTGGAAGVVDFVGSAESARFGFDILGKGGSLVIVGLFGGSLVLPVPHFPLREVTVRGSYVGSLPEFHELMDLARSGRFGPVAVETRSLDQADATLYDLKDGRVSGRIVLVPSRPR